MALKKVNYIDGVTPIGAKNLNDIQDAILGTKTAGGTVTSPNADFAEVAEWADGNPNNEDRTGYFVCANIPLNGIVMKKATSIDDVKGVSIHAPAFAGNYTPDKLDSEGNLLPRYSFVAVLGFVPVIDNGTCTVGGRCMPDDNGCAVPSINSMGYQVVNRIDENRVLIIIEPNGDMVQRIKTKINKIEEDVELLKPNDFEVIAEGELTEAVNSILINKDKNGNPLALQDIFTIYFYSPKAEKTNYTTIKINNRLVSQVPTMVGSAETYSKTYSVFNGYEWETFHAQAAPAGQGAIYVRGTTPFRTAANSNKTVSSIQLYCYVSTDTMPVGFKYKIYGRRAK